MFTYTHAERICRSCARVQAVEEFRASSEAMCRCTDKACADAVNQALYAAASAVETPGGQSIVALLAHVPKVLR